MPGKRTLALSSEIFHRLAVAFVIVLVLDVPRRWAHQHAPPQCFREMRAEAQPLRVRQRIDKPANPILFRAHQFAYSPRTG